MIRTYCLGFQKGWDEGLDLLLLADYRDSGVDGHFGQRGQTKGFQSAVLRLVFSISRFQMYVLQVSMLCFVLFVLFCVLFVVFFSDCQAPPVPPPGKYITS